MDMQNNLGNIKAWPLERQIWNNCTEGLDEDLKRFLYYLVKDSMTVCHTADDIAEAWQADPEAVREIIERLENLSVLAVLPHNNTVFFDLDSFAMFDFSVSEGVW